MDVWDYLGIKRRRKKEHTVQKVKHYDEVQESKKVFPMYGQIKKDGVYALVVCRYHSAYGKDVAIFTRTGMSMTNLEDLSIGMQNWSRFGVYIAELCNDKCSLESLSGMVNPNRVKDLTDQQLELMSHTHLVFHDCITIDQLVSGHSILDYTQRLHNLHALMKRNTDADYTYLEAQKLNNEKELRAFADFFINKGEEGVVLKQEVGWLAGHKGFRMMKIVRDISYDLKVVSLEYGDAGTKREGMITNAILKWKDGKEIKADLGKGWTDDKRVAVYNDHYSLIGKIVKVTALQESSKGKLRLPKVEEIRIDKTEGDF